MRQLQHVADHAIKVTTVLHRQRLPLTQRVQQEPTAAQQVSQLLHAAVVAYRGITGVWLRSPLHAVDHVMLDIGEWRVRHLPRAAVSVLLDTTAPFLR